MTDSEKLCDITQVLRKHNQIIGGISDSEAIYQIRKILDESDTEAERLPIFETMTYICTNCRKEFLSDFDICPYCNARMRKEKTNDRYREAREESRSFGRVRS